SSLTGGEAISNAVPNFKKPKRKNTANTLGIMALILGIFFAGITFLSYYLGILPNSKQTVLSQLGIAVFGHGVLFYLLQFSTSMILVVAANTYYFVFPIIVYYVVKVIFN